MVPVRRLSALGAIVLILATASWLKADGSASIYLGTFPHDKGPIIIQHDTAAKLPPWTPQSSEPAPLSMDEAWKLIHGTGQQAAGDAPFWTTYIQLTHGAKAGQEIWFYRADGSYTAYRDNQAFSEAVTYIILMDGTMLTESYEYPNGRTLPPNYKRPKMSPTPPKPRTNGLPDKIVLLNATYMRGPNKMTVPYTMPRDRFLAMTAWNFDHPEPPPVSLDQALKVARFDTLRQWPGKPWIFVDIRLEPGKTNDSDTICFYTITIRCDSPDPTQPSTLLMRVIPMDGGLVGPDLYQVAPYGSGVGD